MNDYFERDYKELKDLYNKVLEDLRKRKEISNTSENTVRLEQQIFKNLDNLKKQVEVSITGYKKQYKNNTNISEIEANKRLNMLNAISQNYTEYKKSYDEIINSKYQYVSNCNFRNMI